MASDEALRRLTQAEEHIRDKHPRAARDGQLASILGALRDELRGDAMTLNDVMAIDHVVRITDDGIADDVTGVYAPELLMATDSEGSILAEHEADYVEQAQRQGWTLLHGFTRQHGYRGVGMHDSEVIGGALETFIRDTPGLYVAVEITTDDDDDEPTGWVVAYREG